MGYLQKNMAIISFLPYTPKLSLSASLLLPLVTVHATVLYCPHYYSRTVHVTVHLRKSDKSFYLPLAFVGKIISIFHVIVHPRNNDKSIYLPLAFVGKITSIFHVTVHPRNSDKSFYLPLAFVGNIALILIPIVM